MSANPVPFIYRAIFTFIDPLFCLLGAKMHLFDITDTMNGYSSTYQGQTTTEVQHLLDSITGFFLMLGIVEAILLRVRGKDVVVWRVVQGAAAWVDILMVWGAYRMLSTEGRLMDFANYRGDDWRLLVGNAVIGLVRIACALGVGMDEGVKTKTV